MERTMTLGELPGFFRKLQTGSLGGRINQANGDVMAPIGRTPDDKKEAMLAVKDMCGVCIAGHVADQAKTRTYSLPPGHLHAWDGEEELGMLLEGPSRILNESGSRVVYRSHKDGILTLFKTLLKGRHFKDWLKANGHGKLTRAWHEKCEGWYDVMRVLESYLRRTCGAPYRCFSENEWPEDTDYADVFGRLVKHNPDIADRPLAKLRPHENHGLVSRR